MLIIVLSTIQMIMTAYNITLFLISMKKWRDYDKMVEKNQWQAKKIRELGEKLRSETETKTH